MPLKVDQLAAQYTGDLIHPVREQKPPVEHGNFGVFFGHIGPVHIDGSGHGEAS